MRKNFVLLLLVSVTASFGLAQLMVTPESIAIEPMTLHSSASVTVTVADLNGAHVSFNYAGVASDTGIDFLMVIPSSGTTPARVQLGVNPNVLALLRPSTNYYLAVNFEVVGQTPTALGRADVELLVPPEPPPTIQSVVSSASLQPVLSPGALVSIFGSYLTGPTLSTTFDDTASYPTSVASTSVTFNGIAAPLLYVSPGQINAIVPFSLAGQSSLEVIVQRFDRVSASITSPLQDTAPAIFTSTQNGTGQAAVLQQGSDGSFTYTSSGNPAAPGAVLEIFATGEGVWTPPSLSDVFIYGEAFTTQPVSLLIGGQPAKILYVGALGTLSNWSVLQVNAAVPNGISSGPQSIVLTIGAHDSSQQNVVVWVQ